MDQAKKCGGVQPQLVQISDTVKIVRK